MSPQLRAPKEALQFSLPLFRGVAKAALDCAHRATPILLNDPSKLACFSLHRVAWLILECARRTSTFLSCAFREQEDGQAAHPTLPRARVARAQGTHQATSPPLLSGTVAHRQIEHVTDDDQHDDRKMGG